MTASAPRLTSSSSATCSAVIAPPAPRRPLTRATAITAASGPGLRSAVTHEPEAGRVGEKLPRGSAVRHCRRGASTTRRPTLPRARPARGGCSAKAAACSQREYRPGRQASGLPRVSASVHQGRRPVRSRRHPRRSFRARGQDPTQGAVLTAFRWSTRPSLRPCRHCRVRRLSPDRACCDHPECRGLIFQSRPCPRRAVANSWNLGWRTAGLSMPPGPPMAATPDARVGVLGFDQSRPSSRPCCVSARQSVLPTLGSAIRQTSTLFDVFSMSA